MEKIRTPEARKSLRECVRRFVTHEPEKPFRFEAFDDAANSVLDECIRTALKAFANDVWESLSDADRTAGVKTRLFYKVYKTDRDFFEGRDFRN